MRSATCFPLCSQCVSLISIQTTIKQRAACETWVTFQLRNTRAVKHTHAGPGHGGGTPPARIRLRIRGKGRVTVREKACFLSARFPCLFLAPWGRHVDTYLNATAAHCLNYTPTMFRNRGSRGFNPLVQGSGGRRGPQKPGQSTALRSGASVNSPISTMQKRIGTPWAAYMASCSLT